MNDLRYQVELLTALNDKLTSKEKMCDFILNTSSGAFIYHDFEESQIHVMGNWDRFFDFQFKNVSDYTRMLEIIDEKDTDHLKEILYLEKTQSSRFESRTEPISTTKSRSGHFLLSSF